MTLLFFPCSALASNCLLNRVCFIFAGVWEVNRNTRPRKGSAALNSQGLKYACLFVFNQDALLVVLAERPPVTSMSRQLNVFFLFLLFYVAFK